MASAMTSPPAAPTTTTTPPRTEDLVLFKSICADFEDILPHDLHDTFSKHLQRPYLHPIITSPPYSSVSSSTTPNASHPNQHAKATSMIAHQKLVSGIVWGASLRPIISLSVQITESILTLSGTRFPINVHFLYLPASPQTYLSDEALRALGIEDMVVVGEHSIAPMASTPLDPVSVSVSSPFGNTPFSNSCNTEADGHEYDGSGSDEFNGNGICGGVYGDGRNGSYSSTLLRLPLRINGYTTLVARSPADGHFSHLNILGQDFVQLSGAHVYFGGQIPRFEISFP